MSEDIILYDSHCLLCDAWVQRIIRQDPVGRYRFLSLQDPLAAGYLAAHGYDPQQLETMVLIHEGDLLFKSSAAIEIARHLTGKIRALKYFKCVPKIFRDRIYDIVAKHRYRIWGRSDDCLLPDESIKNRFIG